MTSLADTGCVADPALPSASPLTQLNAAFAFQRAAFDAQAEPSTWIERLDLLGKLQAVLMSRRHELARAISADFKGRAAAETLLLEVFGLIDEIRHTRKQLRRWMRVRSVATNWQFWPSRSRIAYQPLGVVGVIGAFNYPAYVALSPAIGALAAGNRVLIKPSEQTPHTAELLRRMIEQAFPQKQLAVVCGDLEISKAFAALPFDHLVFTGSARVGRQILQLAAANLTPVTLELGGKSPVIIDSDYPMQLAADAIMHAKLLNAGQTCLAPDYVLLPANRRDEFLHCARHAVRRYYPKLVENAQYTRIVSPREYERLTQWTTEARERGATVETINPQQENCDVFNQVFAPTLVWNCPLDIRLMREEIFGPILPVMACASFDQALQHIKAGDKPLALYLFSRDAAVQRQSIWRTLSGALMFNGCLYHVAQHALPLGGVGASGMGRYHGFDGFETFSKKKPLFSLSRLTPMGLLRPPFGRIFGWLLGTLLHGWPTREKL